MLLTSQMILRPQGHSYDVPSVTCDLAKHSLTLRK